MMSRAFSTGSDRIGAEVVGGWSWAEPRPRRIAPQRRSWPALALKSFAMAAIIAAALGLVGFVLFAASIDRAERAPYARADGIVALTGGSQRIGDAIDLLALGYADRLLITGVNERTSREEIARLNPGQRRLVECCVDLDYRARNTIGNAIAARHWAQDKRFRSLIVVTSNYHMPRTLLELDHVLPGVEKVPYPVVSEAVPPGSWWRNPATVRLLASEYAKFVVGWLRTRIEGDPERSAAAVLMGRGKPVKKAAIGRMQSVSFP